MQPQGFVETGFGRVADAFARHGLGDAGGAALCVYQDGRVVVDVAGGCADAQPGHPYDARTLQLVFSCTKGVTAIVAHLLAERGLLQMDAPISRYWPEFAAAGKDAVTVESALAHRAGLPRYDVHLTREQVCDGVSAARALAAQAPYWDPGSTHGYHAVTFGFLVGELVKRVDGRTLGQFLYDEIAVAWGLDVWIGLPEEHEHRVARLVPAPLPAEPALLASLRRFAPDTVPGRTLTLDGALPVAGRAFAYNDRDVRAAEIPASNAVCSARGLAGLYSATVVETNRARLLDAHTVRHATETLSHGPDEILGLVTRFGRGFMLPTDEVPMLSPASFGHPGTGGSLGLADPELGVGMAYTTSYLGARILGDPRANTLVDAVRASLG